MASFRNWKKAHEKFNEHQKSSFHCINIELIFHREHMQAINLQLDTIKSVDEHKAQKCLLTIITSLRYLARAGLDTRGPEYNEVNLIEILEERTVDVPELKEWLLRINNYVSAEIRNELIEVMAHTLFRDIMTEAEVAPFLSIIADCKTDIQEQFSICSRFVDPKTLIVNEYFVGMYNSQDSMGVSLASTIKEVLLRLNMPISKLRAECFDGARNMSAKNIKECKS